MITPDPPVPPIGAVYNEVWQDYHDLTARPVQVRWSVVGHHPAPECDCGQFHADIHVEWSDGPLTAPHYVSMKSARVDGWKCGGGP